MHKDNSLKCHLINEKRNYANSSQKILVLKLIVSMKLFRQVFLNYLGSLSGQRWMTKNYRIFDICS